MLNSTKIAAIVTKHYDSIEHGVPVICLLGDAVNEGVKEEQKAIASYCDDLAQKFKNKDEWNAADAYKWLAEKLRYDI